MRDSAWMLAGALALTAVPVMAAGRDGLPAGAGQGLWSPWQGRVSLGTTSAPSGRPGADNLVPGLGSVSVMGDYYFGRWLTGPQGLGGFRATSGVVFGRRPLLGTGRADLADGRALSIGTQPVGGADVMPFGSEVAADRATLPYFGFGYTALSLRYGWSFSADLGLIARDTGGVARLGRGLSGNQSLDDAVRDLRMRPLFQLGVSYSF